MTVTKENAGGIHSIRMRSGNSDAPNGYYTEQTLYGDEQCSSGRSCLRNATMQKIDNICSSCESEEYCSIVLYLMIKKTR